MTMLIAGFMKRVFSVTPTARGPVLFFALLGSFGAMAQDRTAQFASEVTLIQGQLQSIEDTCADIERAEIGPFQNTLQRSVDLMVEIATDADLAPQTKKDLLRELVPAWLQTMTVLTEPYIDIAHLGQTPYIAPASFWEVLGSRISVFFKNLARDITSAFVPYQLEAKHWSVPDAWFRLGSAARRTEVVDSAAKVLLAHLREASSPKELNPSQIALISFLGSLAHGLRHTESVQGYPTHQWVRRLYFFLGIFFHLKPPVFLTLGDVTYGAVETSSYAFLAGFLFLARARRVNSGMNLGAATQKMLEVARTRGIACEDAFRRRRLPRT